MIKVESQNETNPAPFGSTLQRPSSSPGGDLPADTKTKPALLVRGLEAWSGLRYGRSISALDADRRTALCDGMHERKRGCMEARQKGRMREWKHSKTGTETSPACSYSIRRRTAECLPRNHISRCE
ncbi:hypothetical protein BSZ35_10090 [Salinibacter sp. 10B]|nr:hypothetical protein BSZ35_10090 [Salinibacter sp. 10B]